MSKELQQVKVCVGRFQPFTKGHLKMATFSDLQGPDKEQSDKLREQPDLKEISKLKTVILSIYVDKSKVDTRHPFDAELMKEEMEIIKKNYKEIEDVLYVSSADICAWGEMLKGKGYQAAVWLTGSDEAPHYAPMAIKVPDYEISNRDNRDVKDAFTKSFYVESIERSDEHSDFVATISGTKVRQSLKDEDKEYFKKAMPDGVDRLFDKFREAVINAPEPVKKTKRNVKEGMKSLRNYIFEKLQ